MLLDAAICTTYAQWKRVAGMLHVPRLMLETPSCAQLASCMSKAALTQCKPTRSLCKSGWASVILPEYVNTHLQVECTESVLLCAQVAILQHRLKGALTYGICKNLTEQMIASYHMQPFPVCINRPVGIGPVAKLPCPGYVGNTAGPTGMMLSIACGMSAGSACLGLPALPACVCYRRSYLRCIVSWP